jgi:RNA polymerase sigma-70 factor (ECF subfamily)
MTAIRNDRVNVAPESRAAEAALIARVRSGDETACEELVRDYGPRMLAVARRFLSCHEDCNDAVQDAFISAFRAIDSFGGTSSLGTWLHRVTVNACLMKLRRRKGEAAIEPLLPQFVADGHHAAPVPAWDGDAFAAVSAAETRAWVRACIERLPEPYRVVLILRDIEERDTRETAQLLQCTVANVKTRLHRARQALRTLLEAGACSLNPLAQVEPRKRRHSAATTLDADDESRPVVPSSIGYIGVSPHSCGEENL